MSQRIDIANHNVDNNELVLSSGSISEPPDFLINCTDCHLTLNLASVQMKAGAVTKGNLKIAQDASVTTLNVGDGGTIELASGTLTATGTVTLSGENALTGPGTLSASQKNIRVQNNLLLNSNLDGTILLQEKTTTMNSGSITGSLSVQQNSQFVFNGGAIATDISVSGVATIAGSISAPSNRISTDSASTITFDSSGAALSVEFEEFEFASDL